LRTWVGNYRPFTATLTACSRNREEALLRADLTGAATIGTRARTFRAAPRPRAVASFTVSEPLKLDDFFGASCRFLEFDL
jgi:hypothetical protein